jgi:hypothetical protein
LQRKQKEKEKTKGKEIKDPARWGYSRHVVFGGAEKLVGV